MELRDGATEMASLIGTFCSTLPGTQESTGNLLRVRYFNDEALPGNGFTANVSVGGYHDSRLPGPRLPGR